MEYYDIPTAEALKELGTDERGLTADEALKRRQEHGPNALAAK